MVYRQKGVMVAHYLLDKGPGSNPGEGDNIVFLVSLYPK